MFEYPEVRRTDARLVFPEYTAIETKVVEDVRHVTAVEGTELTLTFRLNKEVAEANLVDEQGAGTPLKPQAEGSNLYAATFTLADSHRYKVQLKDKEGRASKVPAEVAVNVTRNKPATVAMTQPGARRPGLARRGARPSAPWSTTTSAWSATASATRSRARS